MYTSIKIGFLVVLSTFSFTFRQPIVRLFNGSNLKGWYTYIEKKGKHNDPGKVFSVEGGIIKVTGKEFGYICTEKSYKNYKLTVEFKWGTHRYAPRDTNKRDSGIIYHISSSTKDTIWPSGIECQVQEGDCGDFWIIGNIAVDTKTETKSEYGFQHIAKSGNYERPTTEWNTIVVVSNNGHLQHFVNGMLVNEVFNATVREGKILLQSEGAEVYYRKVELEEL